MLAVRDQPLPRTLKAAWSNVISKCEAVTDVEKVTDFEKAVEYIHFREWRMQREKVDFLAAVSQKLCSVDSSSTGSFSYFIPHYAHALQTLQKKCSIVKN